MLESLGCQECSGLEADGFANQWPNFQSIATLIDESHYIVRIAACPACMQKWISIFTELIDWDDGDDSQARSIMPLKEQEASELIDQADNFSPDKVREFGRNRRVHNMVWPKGGTKGTFWSQGPPFILPHD